MLKTTLIVATTLDGFIAQTAHQVSTNWTSQADQAFFARESKRLGALIMGRPTYATIGRPLSARLNIVLTSQPELLTPPSSPTLASLAPTSPTSPTSPSTPPPLPLESLPTRPPDQPITDFIAAHHLDAQPFYTDLPAPSLLVFLSAHGLDAVAICGGARVYSSFLEQNLVDAIAMTVEGIFFGEGVKLASFTSPSVPNLGLPVPKSPKKSQKVPKSPKISPQWRLLSAAPLGDTTLSIHWQRISPPPF